MATTPMAFVASLGYVGGEFLFLPLLLILYDKMHRIQGHSIHCVAGILSLKAIQFALPHF